MQNLHVFVIRMGSLHRRLLQTHPLVLLQGLPSLVTAAQAPGQAYPASSNALQLYGLPVCWLTKIADSGHLHKLPASLCVLTCLALCWEALAYKHSGDDHRVCETLISSELAYGDISDLDLR